MHNGFCIVLMVLMLGSRYDSFNILHRSVIGNRMRYPTQITKCKQRDPDIELRAKELGVRLDKFENRGIEEEALREILRIADQQHKRGFATAIPSLNSTMTVSTSSIEHRGVNVTVSDILKEGMNKSITWREMLERKRTIDDSLEDFSLAPPQLQVAVNKDSSYFFDIFADPSTYLPSQDESNVLQSFEKSMEDGDLLQLDKSIPAANTEYPPKPEYLERDKSRLRQCVSDMMHSDISVHEKVMDSYRDVILSENFLFLMSNLNRMNKNQVQRTLLSKLSIYSMNVVAELAIAVQKESLRHLETIKDVCEIAVQYKGDEQMFLTKLDEIKPRFDTSLLAYLKYAIDEEKKMMALKNPGNLAPTAWLQVLILMQRGVIAEFTARYENLMEPLLIVLRFHPADLRSRIFEQFVNTTSAMELRYMRELAINMIKGIENDPTTRVKNSIVGFNGEDSLFERSQYLMQDIQTYLSLDYISSREEDYKRQASLQNVSVIIKPRNPTVKDY